MTDYQLEKLRIWLEKRTVDELALISRELWHIKRRKHEVAAANLIGRSKPKTPNKHA